MKPVVATQQIQAAGNQQQPNQIRYNIHTNKKSQGCTSVQPTSQTRNNDVQLNTTGNNNQN